MKRRSALPLLLCLLVLLLTACGNGGKENNTTTWTTEQMAGAILAAGDSTAQVSAIRSQETQFASYAEGYYRLNEAVEEGTILYVGGVSALEVAVFRLAGDADTAKAEAALQAYIDGRAGAFTGYAPEEAAVLESPAPPSGGSTWPCSSAPIRRRPRQPLPPLSMVPRRPRIPCR